MCVIMKVLEKVKNARNLYHCFELTTLFVSESKFFLNFILKPLSELILIKQYCQNYISLCIFMIFYFQVVAHYCFYLIGSNAELTIICL